MTLDGRCDDVCASYRQPWALDQQRQAECTVSAVVSSSHWAAVGELSFNVRPYNAVLVALTAPAAAVAVCITDTGRVVGRPFKAPLSLAQPPHGMNLVRTTSSLLRPSLLAATCAPMYPGVLVVGRSALQATNTRSSPDQPQLHGKACEDCCVNVSKQQMLAACSVARALPLANVEMDLRTALGKPT